MNSEISSTRQLPTPQFFEGPVVKSIVPLGKEDTSERSAAERRESVNGRKQQISMALIAWSCV